MICVEVQTGFRKLPDDSDYNTDRYGYPQMSARETGILFVPALVYPAHCVPSGQGTFLRLKDKGREVGLISIGDLIKSKVMEQETLIEQLSGYIGGKYV